MHTQIWELRWGRNWGQTSPSRGKSDGALNINSTYRDPSKRSVAFPAHMNSPSWFVSTCDGSSQHWAFSGNERTCLKYFCSIHQVRMSEVCLTIWTFQSSTWFPSYPVLRALEHGLLRNINFVLLTWDVFFLIFIFVFVLLNCVFTIEKTAYKIMNSWKER